MTTAATQNQETLRYPIGRFEWGKEYSEKEVTNLIRRIESFPAQLKKLVTGMTQQQLDTPYREGGWTVRQVIHHLFDSHMNAYARFKLALTEEIPTIKPYNEKLWAELEDAKTMAPSVSISLLENLHKRWIIMLKNMTAEDFDRRFMHPEHNHVFALKEILAMYVWHGDHHYEHINMVKKHSAPSSVKANKKVVVKKSSPKKS